MDGADPGFMLKALPVPAVLIDIRTGTILHVNELAAQAGFEVETALTDLIVQRETVKAWLAVREEPVALFGEMKLSGCIKLVTASARRVTMGGQDMLLAVFTSIKDPGEHEDDQTVAALCEIYASGHRNALQAFLQSSAFTLGAFCAAVYEKRKDRYIIREEWRGRRTVSVSILGVDFDVHPEQEMARIGQIKRAAGLGYAPFIKTYGTHSVLVYFFDTPVDPVLQPRIERYARLLRVLAPDIPRHGSSAVMRQGLDSLQQGVAIWDKAGKKLIYENKAFHALFGGSVPFTDGRLGIAPDSYSDAAGRHYSLTHTVGRLGSQRLVTTHVADVTRYKLAEHKLAMTAKTDPLTGLFNRRAGLEILEEVYERSRKSGRPLTVGFADIDGLKAVNDTYGHGAGDAMIRSVAEMLKKHVGKEGTVCRLGGDEFVLILPGMNQVQALLMAEQIKSAVAKCFVGNSRGISISFGFKQAEYTREETTASLVSVADTDMYRDKRDNRSAD